MRRSLHHTTQTNSYDKNKHTPYNATPPPPRRGAESKPSKKCVVDDNVVPHQRHSSLQARAAIWTLPPWGYRSQAAHTQSSIPLLQWCFRRTHLSQHQWKTLFLATLCGGLTSRLTLPRTQISETVIGTTLPCNPSSRSPLHLARQLKPSSTHGPVTHVFPKKTKCITICMPGSSFMHIVT
jgi:hypothetical protein